MLADDLRRLAEEILGAYQERVRSIAEAKKETAEKLAVFKTDLDKAEINRKNEAQAEISDRQKHIADLRDGTLNLINDFESARKEMWGDLKAQLQNFTSELANFRKEMIDASKERKEMTLEEIAERREDLDILIKATRDLLTSFGTARSEMAADLKERLDAFTLALSQFKADLDRAETERKDTVTRELKEKAEELRANLSNFSADMSASVASLMGELKKDRSEAAQAWSEILSVIRSAAGGMTLTSPTYEPKSDVSVSEIEEEKEESIETQDEAQSEALQKEIVALLRITPDGLKMVGIAEKLGVASWRSLIPIMRILLDDAEIKKEDSTYFVV